MQNKIFVDNHGHNIFTRFHSFLFKIDTVLKIYENSMTQTWTKDFFHGQFWLPG